MAGLLMATKNDKATLYIDMEEGRKAEKKAKKEIDPSMSLSMLVRVLLRKYVNGEITL